MDIILGYIGGANVGKDTANGIVKNLVRNASCYDKEIEERGYCPETFAGVSVIGGKIGFFYIPLALEVKKEYAKQNLGVDLVRLFTDVAYKNKHRQGLIDIGDGWREQRDPLIWIHLACKNIEAIKQKYSNLEHRIYTIPDMRYINELPAFEEYAEKKEWPILSIKVHCSIGVRLARMAPEAAKKYICKHKNNQSERNNKLIHADIEVFNNGTLQELEGQLTNTIIPVMNILLR